MTARAGFWPSGRADTSVRRSGHIVIRNNPWDEGNQQPAILARIFQLQHCRTI